MTNPSPPFSGRALVLQHHPDEDSGALGPLLAQAGLDVTAVELDHHEPIPPLNGFDVLLAMGGPMNVWQETEHPWLVDEKAAIRHWVGDLGRPFLGVCLGHQLLAEALGGSVGPMDEPEIGVMKIDLTAEGRSDEVFGDLPENLLGLQWHEAAVLQPPEGAAVLARNDHCAVQALRVGACAWGVQFHVEVQASTIPKWARVPEYDETLTRTGSSAAALEQAVEAHLGTMADTTRMVFVGLMGAIAGVSVQP